MQKCDCKKTMSLKLLSIFVIVALLAITTYSQMPLKFDFGSGKTAAGWTPVINSDIYSKDKGYGFEESVAIECLARKKGDDLRSDFCTSDKPFYFSVKVPEGNYKVTVTFGHRLTTGMFTDFNDALWLTATEQLKQITGRKAIIVLTDGIDSGRGLKTSEQALRAVLESEAPVYAVSKTEIQRGIENRNLEYYEKNYSLSSSRIKIDGLKMSLAALEQGERWLTRLAEETGGRIFCPRDLKNLKRFTNK